MYQNNQGFGGGNTSRGGFTKQGQGNFGGFGSSNKSNNYQSGAGYGYNRRGNDYRSGGSRGGGGYRGSRGRGRGSYRGRGGSGGRGGRHGGGGIKLATDIAQFNGAIDAHQSKGGGATGVTAMSAWPEGQKLFSGGMDGSVKLFDFNGNLITEQQEGQSIGSLYFSRGWLFVGFLGPGPPGQEVGFVKGYNFTKEPVDVVNFALNDQFPAAHHAQVKSICVNGEMVLTGSLDRTLKAWKYDPAKNVWSVFGVYGGQNAHNSGVCSIAAYQGKTFSGSESGELKVWDSSNGTQINAINAHNGKINEIVGWEGNNMHVILTCGDDSTVKVWDLSQIQNPQVQPLFVYQPRKIRPFCSMFPTKLGDGRDVLFCGYQDGGIQIFDLPDFSDLGFLDGHKRNNPITCLIHTDKLLFAGSLDGNLNCFSLV